MDKEQVRRELSSQAIRLRFSELLRIHNAYHSAQSEASIHGESPEYAEYSALIKKLFGPNPTPRQALEFNFQAILIFIDMLGDHYEKLLSLIPPDPAE